jgi:hypothetical protein
MPTVRGEAAVRAYIAGIPAEMEEKVLRGAARAAATVVADEAKARSISAEVAAAVKVATRKETDRMVAKVQVKGEGAYLGPWLEYGTSPHFISVDESQRGGMSIGRINQKYNEGSLVIGGEFVGSTVFHPGARPHPFLRPALDIKHAEAIAAAQGYINTRVTRSGIVGAAEGDDA